MPETEYKTGDEVVVAGQRYVLIRLARGKAPEIGNVWIVMGYASLIRREIHESWFGTHHQDLSQPRE